MDKVPSPEIQKALISEALTNEVMKVGDTFYLIESKWLREWNDWTYRPDGFPPPGKIENDSIIDANGQLKQNLFENYDFKLFGEKPWNYIFSWYGGNPIPRKVIEKNGGSLMVEIREWELTLLRTGDVNKKTILISRAALVGELRKVAAELYDMSTTDIVLWDYYNNAKLSKLDDDTSNIEESRIFDKQAILVQTATESKESDSTKDSNYRYNSYYRPTPPSAPGLVGLSNLGNTCFMNSALQCLSNIPPLREYFRSSEHMVHINRDNPIGTGGKLAEEYGKLVSEMWSGQYSVVTPRNFKYTLGHFAEQFSGFDQHDSQELLAYLLDMLHEDVNQIKKKPFVEQAQAKEGELEEEAAQRAWDLHLQRNKSKIVEIFHAQFKSIVTCPDCEKTSITFDPYMYLSLPLPIEEEERYITYRVMPADGSLPVKMSIRILRENNIAELISAIANSLQKQRENLILADIDSHSIYHVFSHNERSDRILDMDTTFLYEMNCPQSSDSEQKLDSSVWRESMKKFFDNTYFERIENLENLTDSERESFLYDCHSLIQVIEKKCSSGSEISDIFRYYNYSKFKNIRNEADFEEFKKAFHLLRDYVQQTFEKFMNIQVIFRSRVSNYSYMRYQPFGMPLFIRVTNKTTLQEFIDQVANRVQRFVKPRYTEGTDYSINSFLIDELDLYARNSSSMYWNIKNDLGVKIDVREHLDTPISKIIEYPLIIFDWTESKKQEYFDVDECQRFVDQSIIPPKKQFDLTCCLNLFMQREQLSPTEMWYCSECKDHKQASKQLSIWSTPSVLIIHFKRFRYNARWRDKIEDLIEFPHDFDLKDYILNKNQLITQYHLIAISNHFGGMGGGHYTAYVFNSITKKWYNCDDSSVCHVGPEDIMTDAAYVLFYLRHDLYEHYLGNASLTSASNEEKEKSSDDDSDNLHPINSDQMQTSDNEDDATPTN